MAESFCRVGDIEICYETFGHPSDPAMLLIMGLGTQMVAWHDAFCASLAERGFFVIRHDNRDIGRSTHMDDAPTPSFLQLARRDRNSPYTLADMAADSVGVLDHLGIERAHVVGASMGGMIAQTVAIRHPQRTLSLVSIMSNTGSFWSGQPALGMYAVLLKPSPRDRESYIQRGVDMFTKIGGSGFPPDVEDLREIAALSFDRARDPKGSQRQLWAIVADRDRTPDLRRLRVPATVIHGQDDRLVRPSGGRTTAKAIPGAELVEIPGMGHGLPRGAWPMIVEAIVGTAGRAAADANAASRRDAPPHARKRLIPGSLGHLGLPHSLPLPRIRPWRAPARGR
jgi:pimeloyl-ACP methyl ester carboxylesterase